MGTEQHQKVLCVSLAVYLYAKMNAGTVEYIIKRFWDRDVAVSLLNRDMYLLLVLETNEKLPYSFGNMRVLFLLHVYEHEENWSHP